LTTSPESKEVDESFEASNFTLYEDRIKFASAHHVEHLREQDTFDPEKTLVKVGLCAPERLAALDLA
jgi:hypothetical protein